MKALIKGGLCLALSWLASGASAQELPVKWQASPARNASPIAVVSTSADPAPKTDTVTRPVTLSVPTPLDGAAPPTLRPASGSFAPIIRAQAADDKAVQPVPKLEIVPVEPKLLQRLPRDKDFTPPAPQVVPSPLFGSLGITHETGFLDGCGPSFCNPSCCMERPRFWMSAEYLMWWQRAQSVPPLIISSPVGTQPLLGLNTTTILYDSIPNPMRSGGRFAVGMWMPHFDNRLGAEANFFFLGRQSNTATFGTNGNPLLARPFNDTTPLALDPNAVNGPNAEFFRGATVSTFSEVWGFEGNLRYKWLCGSNCWLDVLGGYRNLNINEGLTITEDAQGTFRGQPVFAHEVESFRTRNQFNGFQLGLDGEVRFWNRWFLGMTTKVAMGNTHQIIDIAGSTTFSGPGITTNTQQGALLASTTNIGRYTANRFGVLPETSLKIGINLTEHLRLFVGYDFMYLNNVARPGDQIDLNVNQAFRPGLPGQPGFANFLPAAAAGPRQPAVLFKTSDYWAQGLNFGLQYRY